MRNRNHDRFSFHSKMNEMNENKEAPTTGTFYTVSEIMKLWKPEWSIPNTREKISELLPTLQKDSDRLQGPWAMTYEIAKKTFEYLDYLKTKVYVVVIDKQRFASYLLFSPKGQPKHLLPYIKNINQNLNWDKQTKKQLQRGQWKFMSCIFQDSEEKKDIEDVSQHSYYKYLTQVFENMIKLSKKESSFQDGMYIFSLRDVLLVRKDGKHPWIDIVGNFFSPMIPKKFLPIFNSTGGNDYWDIPIPTFDDLRFIRGIPEEYQTLSTDISKKIPKAFFRGSATGCGYTVETNPRMRLAKMAPDYPEFLDAGITIYAKKFKFYRGFGVGFVDFDREKIVKVPVVRDIGIKSQFRYTIEIEGNVAAHRVATDLLLGTVPLIVESEFTLWFSHLLVPYQHYLPIKRDLSNLIEMIEWGNQHLDICQKIVMNARNFALEILQKDVLLNLMRNYFLHIKIEN